MSSGKKSIYFVIAVLVGSAVVAMISGALAEQMPLNTDQTLLTPSSVSAENSSTQVSEITVT